MQHHEWTQIWAEAKTTPAARAAFGLLVFNGLRVAQIERLSAADLDLAGGWVRTFDGESLPLTTECRAALEGLPEPLAPNGLAAALVPYAALETDAHRRLSGALWITDPDTQLILETVGSREAPVLPLRFSFPFSVAERMSPDDPSPIAVRARSVLQAAADWLAAQMSPVRVGALGKALSLLRQGKLVFLLISTGVSGLNLIHNVLMGRLLSPADYSQLTFIITLQLLFGLLPAMLQTVVARFGARYAARDELAALGLMGRRLGRLGWALGAAAGVLLLLLSPVLASLFQIEDAGLLLPIGLALPFFVVTGVDRGLLQGGGRYFWLSGAYLTEGVIRLGISVLLGYALITVGRSLDGAVWALAQSMIATWFIAWLALRHFPLTRAPLTPEVERSERAGWMQVGLLTAMALVGQVLITNSDFILVKNFFAPSDAGMYAAVSVLGRIVYFGALPLTILLVPLIAQRQALGEATRPIFILLIGGGVAVCGLLIGVAALFAPQILGLLYGDAYLSAASLLAPYALAASLYTLTHLAITYQIALGNGGESWMPLLAAGLQIMGIVVFHETLTQIILVQIVLMGILFAAVSWRILRAAPVPLEPPVPVTAPV